MHIEVKSTNVTTEKTSKGTVLHKQQVAIDQGKDYPLIVSLTVPEGHPYAPGKYTLDPNSFRSSRFGALELDPYKIRLVPVTVGK